MKTKIYLLIFLFISLNTLMFDIGYSQWGYLPIPQGQVTVYSLTSCGDNIIAATQFNGIYISSNNGTNWTQTLSNRSVFALTSNGIYVCAGTWNYGVYISTNDGINWSHCISYFDNVYSVGIIGTTIFAGTDIGIYISTNNGVNWIQTLSNIIQVHAFESIGNNIFAGTETGVYLSINNGINWVQTSLNNQDIRAIAVNGNILFAGTFTFPNQGVYLSSNFGANWVLTALNNNYIYSLAVSGNYLLAGTEYNGVYVSSNNGSSWTARNEGLVSGYKGAGALCIFNNYIFAGIYQQNGNRGVFRRPAGEIVNVNSIKSIIGDQISLSQNYPNPFNPITKIKFDISTVGQRHAFDVQLIIYDILGREIATLVNKQLQPGTYEVEWSATGGGSNYPSGVYFYKLITEDYSETKKMVLIK